MRRRFTFLSLGAGFLIVSMMIIFAGIREVYKNLVSMDVKLLTYVLIIQVSLILLFALRWSTFISTLGRKIGSMNVVVVSLVGFLMNSITPGAKAGGEPVRAYLLSKLERMNTTKCFATIVAERLYDVLAYLIVILLGIIWIYRSAELTIMESALLLGGTMLTVFLMWIVLNISINKKKSKKFIRYVLRIIRNIRPLAPKVKEWNDKVDEAIEEYSSTFKDAMVSNVLKGMLISMMMRVLELIRLFLVAKALHTDLSFGAVLSVYVLVLLTYLLPSPPAGLGVVDAAYVMAFKIVGINTALAASIMIVDRFFSTAFPAILGIASTYYVGFRKLRTWRKEGADILNPPQAS